MKLISWNVNGLRAVLGKGMPEFVKESEADVICFQETKAMAEQVPDTSFADGYHLFWNSAERKGYSGTAALSRDEPLSVRNGIGIPEHDTEGRVITLEFEHLYVVTVYTPNVGRDLSRLPYRQKWDADFLAYVKTLEADKPVAIGGDLNVAHREIDLARPKENRGKSCFTDEERAGLDRLAESGFLDSFRELEPGPEFYSWWSFFREDRARNKGFRLDYWWISEALRPNLTSASIEKEVLGSDHCPVSIGLDL